MLERIRVYLLGLIILSMTIVSAQDICPELVSDAMAAVDEFCMDLGRNQACYGNVQLNAEAQPDVEDFTFEETGDIVDVADILTLELNPMDTDAGTWGVAVMSLQADIPNTLPGQNVTFILFGDVYIENAASEEQSPMQAFYLRTGIGDAACEEAPDSGLLIQTPEGVDEVAFNVNGVDVSVGSSVLFQTEETSDEEIDMIISTVEGTANPVFNDDSFPAIAGTQIHIPLNQELLPTGRPPLPQSYDDGRFKPLPIGALPRNIDIAPPLSANAIDNLHGQFANGKPPCGLEGLPACEDLPPRLQNGNMPPANNWGERFVPGVNCKPFIADDGGAEGPPPTETSEDLPTCPPVQRADRPGHVDPLALFPDGDRDKDGIMNQDDACPYVAGLAEAFGCPAMPSDKDDDGWPDTIDDCPDVAGLDEFRGCSETPTLLDEDGDGIPNSIDFCPNRSGTTEFRGCPEPPKEHKDSDGDEIPDAFDKCPYIQGVIEFDGCSQDAQNRDSDGDGVSDADDRCPNQRGKPEFKGCPDDSLRHDSDDDGIFGADDKCPQEAGIPEFKGCPDESTRSDSDGDGIFDADDRCPNRPGLPDTHGCPPPDSDGDGVINPEDNCPNRPGPKENNGCPRA